MEAIIIHPKSKKQIRAFEQMAKALDIPFEVAKIEEETERKKAIKLYGEDFVKKIEASERNFEKGEYEHIEIEDLWK